MTTAQLAILKTELTTDPRGYALANKSDFDRSEMLNLARTGVVGNVTLPSGTVVAMVPATPTGAGGVTGGLVSAKRRAVARVDLLLAIDVRDYAATPAGVNNNQMAAETLNAILQNDSIPLINDDGTNNLIRLNLNRLLGDTNGSQTRLGTLAKKSPASRAEELLGEGTVLTEADVRAALNSTP